VREKYCWLVADKPGEQGVWASLSRLGASWRCIFLSAARGSQVKTLSFFGRATAAPWRRALPGDVVVGVPSRSCDAPGF
jgi:hypothetical protein